ncbi:MAG TPA: helix-turn-helix domain-containing protein [Candidatus Jeotgalibaca merdavium]|uniref:Helix-turn-helix domain-containing protein n=1 Tax=Candidatus Jeotgalibaca merdavium TaxID=2838627 RepID=A0A9D2I2P0_9LACT|nr:helix-turn-helix domain-containing protein [Candidatus Jeotgalibaca merdavium]
MNSKFSDRLKLALKESGISQAELAVRAGISRSSITDYLKDRYEAKQDKVYEIARVLNVDEAWLMGYQVNKEKNDISKSYNKNIDTIAAHIDENVTEEEMEDIIKYIDYIMKSSRDK